MAMVIPSLRLFLPVWKVLPLLTNSYFSFDNVNSLSDQIMDKLTNESSSKYNLLYSVYSYPNIILPLFGGVMIDKLGLK